MGLSSFECAAEGLLPQLLMNTVLLVVVLRRTVQALLDWKWSPPNSEEEEVEEEEYRHPENGRERRVRTTWYKACWERNSECCVCLCGFEAEEEVGELGCRHLFHRACLAKWFHRRRATCPLCRSLA